jgi:hypothetical protein
VETWSRSTSSIGRWKGAADATINREQAALKRMHHLADEKKLGGYCPPIRMLEENNVRQGVFERPEFEAILASLPAELKPVFEIATSPDGGSSRRS